MNEFPVVIHHNPDCGTSRNVLQAIEAAGYAPTIIRYMETGWTRAQLEALFAAANLTPRAALRTSKSPAAELGLLEPEVLDAAILDAMLTYPVLVNRPIVATPKGVRLCRPSETVLGLLDRLPPGPFYKEDGEMMIDAAGRPVAHRPKSNAGSTSFAVRPAAIADASGIALVYNQGIDDRVATFETDHRSPEMIANWFDGRHPIVVAVDARDEIVAFAAAFAYADRCVYAGVAEFSVYVRREHRGQGAGRAAMGALIEASLEAGLWKLLSRVFPENAASRALLRGLGFREVGVHERHGKLDGKWRDVVVVERLILENQLR